MIFGIGVDIASESRIGDVYLRQGRRFVDKLLHVDELAAFAAAKKPANHLAKAWAVKEAFAKALGTGVRGFALSDVGVVRDGLGCPSLVFSAAMRALLDARGIAGGHVSISDDAGMVCAFVVLERAPPPR